MAKFTLEQRVDAPRERVFEVATDLRRAPETIRAIQKLDVLTDGPVREGTRFRETRIVFKREATEEMEITAFDPPRAYTVGCDSHGCRYRTEFRFEPDAGGTKVVMEFEAVPLTFGARVMAIVFAPMIKSCLREMKKDLEDLRVAAEGRAAGTRSA